MLITAVRGRHQSRDLYEKRLIGFLKRTDAESPDAFIEFARNNPTLAA
jgi:hypothetical protein